MTKEQIQDELKFWKYHKQVKLNLKREIENEILEADKNIEHYENLLKEE